MSRRPLVRTVPVALALALGLVVSGCGSDDTEPAGTPAEGSSETSDPAEETDETATASPEEEGVLVEVTIEDGTVTPAGDRVEASVGEPVVMEITSDTAGELHVHSTPEQTISFAEGTSSHEVVIEQPGVVEVESHDPDLVVVQLEVR